MTCPICTKNVQLLPQTEMPCEFCKSIIYENKQLEVKVIKSKVSFDWNNFIFGILIIAGVIFTFLRFKGYENTILILGLGYLLGPILGLLQHLIWYKSDNFKDFIDLHRALLNNRLKFYDYGSKIFVVSLFITQLFGIVLLFSELIK